MYYTYNSLGCAGRGCVSGTSSFSTSYSVFASSFEGIETAFEGTESLFVEADFVGRFLAALLIRSSNNDWSFSDI